MTANSWPRVAPGVMSVGFILAAGLFALPASAQTSAQTASEMLKSTMARYAQMQTYHANCAWSAAFGSSLAQSTTSRELWYRTPNLFKVTSAHSAGAMVQTSVSDGSSLVEYASGVPMPAMSYPAPESLAQAASMQMQHPMFCGSLLYQFFGGPARYSSLVDEAKTPVTFGPEEVVDGQPCRTVKFWAPGPTYGKTVVAIGSADGLVRRIRYGSEPLLESMRSTTSRAQIRAALRSPATRKQMLKSRKGMTEKQLNALMAKAMNAPTTFLTTELYTHIAVDGPIDSATFTAKAPAGQQVMQMPQPADSSEPKPPVPIGALAPALHVVGTDGVRHSLADFKGRVVLIDFWATWCGPCVEGLHETQRLYSKYGRQGLAVLTVSDEEKATVLHFVKQNKYTFPVYLDSAGASNKAYKVEAIPTVVVIDKNGKLAAYKVGLSPGQEIPTALQKAGIKME